eukprot:gene8667-10173_t
MKVTVKNINKEIYTFDLSGDEKAGFIACMVRQPKEEAAPAPAPAPVTPVAAPTPVAAATPSPATTPATPNPTPTATSTPASTPASTTSPHQASSFVTGPEYEAIVKEMQNMGFSREDITRALRATYNNPERAVEILLSGNLPALGDEEDEEEGDDVHEHEGDQQGEGEGNIFEALRNHPHFEMLRQTVQRNPSVIPELLQQFNQTNPQLVRQITENPNEFLRLFQDPQQPQQVAIQVTPEERAAIERLISLTGFEKAEVIEAYFACDKDEEMTASFLFERADEPDN